MAHVRNVNQRRVLEFLFRVVRAVLEVVLVQLQQHPIQLLTVIYYKQPVHELLIHPRVNRVVDYLVEVVLVDVHQQLTL